jgi:hypothetical protein
MHAGRTLGAAGRAGRGRARACGATERATRRSRSACICVRYDYAIPGWAVSSPGLWIYFEKGAVQSVQGNRHHIFGEDQALYEARADRPTFESPDFESTFTRGR